MREMNIKKDMQRFVFLGLKPKYNLKIHCRYTINLLMCQILQM
ncbi:unnamed protein product [Arabidopsis halleri]